MSDRQARLRLWTEDVSGALLRGICGVKATGLEKIPRSGPLILACNHVSNLDPLLLGATIAHARKPGYLGKKELFAIPGLAWFLRGVGVIPLDRGTADHSALRAALELLQSGGSLVIFPEGTRVKPGQKRAPKAGVSFLAAKTGARVVPVRVVGTAEFPRVRPLEVRCGSPLEPPAEGREAASSFARAVMEAIYAL